MHLNSIREKEMKQKLQQAKKNKQPQNQTLINPFNTNMQRD